MRVIAATHRNLEEMVKDGRFREDLFYRLEVVPIEVPPLRARRDDIPALAEHFRCEMNTREGRDVPGFQPEVIDRLYAHDWPGNVRELENLVAAAGDRRRQPRGDAGGPRRRTCGWTWSTSSRGTSICRRMGWTCACC